MAKLIANNKAIRKRLVTKEAEMVEVVVIADRSGSMGGTIDEARNAINNLIKEQKELKGKCKFTFIMFDDRYEVVTDREDIKKSKKVGSKYEARGMTALYDAIGKGITHIQNAKKAIVTIVTDGLENASHEYTKKDISELIDKQKGKGWEFQFIGAHISTMAEAQSLNISPAMTLKVDGSAKGVKLGYAFACSNTTSYRADNE